MVLVATRTIAQGEVLTDNYLVDTLHRGDASLFHYGFLVVSSIVFPLLSCVLWA